MSYTTIKVINGIKINSVIWWSSKFPFSIKFNRLGYRLLNYFLKGVSNGQMKCVENDYFKSQNLDLKAEDNINVLDDNKSKARIKDYMCILYIYISYVYYIYINTLILHHNMLYTRWACYILS